MKKRKIILGAMLLGTLTFGTVGLLTSCNDNTVNPGEDLTVTWSGVDTVTLQMNDPQPTDLLEGVKAVASDGTELEVRIDTNSSAQYVDTGYPGTYVVYFYAYLDGEQVDPDDTGYAFKTWVVERGTVLDNSTFDTGVTGWSGNGNAGSVMEYSWDEAENALRVDITNSGGEYWNNQVEYNGLNLDANTTYEISFKAKSTTGRNIGASIEVPAEGYAVVGEYANCLGLTTTDEYQEFKFYYTTTEAKSAIKLGILLGRFTEADDAPSTVWIDDVYVNKLEKTANTSGVVFENAENVEISNLNELETLSEVTAKDANGNEVKLTKRGVVPTSFTSTMTLANWAEEYSYTDSEGKDMFGPNRGDNVVAPSLSKAMGVGHCTVVQDDMNNYWMLYHGYVVNGEEPTYRSLMIDQILFDPETRMPYVQGNTASIEEKAGPYINSLEK